MNGAKHSILALLMMSIFMTSCNDNLMDMESSLTSTNSLEPMTRSTSDSICEDHATLLEETDELKRLYEISNQLKSSKRKAAVATTDDFFYSNIYAINEMPITIKVRSIATSGSTSGYNYLFVNEKGKEVTLNNTNNQAGNRFYLRILPASTGIPYLIYSNVTKTPLAVGQYKSNPDNKILMSAQDDSGSLFGYGWDLLPSTYNKGYFAIESESYLGQSDPNNSWSVFNYVLEAKSNNKLGYSQRVNNKAQQEFLITPIYSFVLDTLTYDLDNATVTSGSMLTKVTSITNPNPFTQKKEFTVSITANETSVFYQTAGKINIPMTNSRNLKFPRPMPIAGRAVLNDDTPKDALYSTTTQQLKGGASYNTSIELKPNTLMQLTTKFKTFNLSVPFVATAKFTYNGVAREIKIAGTWRGYTIANPLYNKPIEEPKFYDLETGNPVNYSLEYDKERNLYIMK